MENTNIQAKIDATLNSLEGIQRAEADAALLQKIEARIAANRDARQTQQVQIRRLAIRLAAAAAVMLVLNFVVWLNASKHQQNDTFQQFSETYFGSQLNY
jgi:hypothetical protein